MAKINIQKFRSPVGELILGSFKGELCLCDWQYRKMRHSIDERIKNGLSAGFIEEDSGVLRATKLQLDEYFSGKRKNFDLPLLMIGSDFQKNVWQELLKIPFGETETYAGLARKLHNENAIRAIASANGANALSIIVPCHRIIGSNGAMIGYAGGLKAKEKLLELEGSKKLDHQLNLFET